MAKALLHAAMQPGAAAQQGVPVMVQGGPSFQHFAPPAGAQPDLQPVVSEALGGGDHYSKPEEIPEGRENQRILIIGAGFGEQMNPAQLKTITDAGFQVLMLRGLPNPEGVADFKLVEQYIPNIQKDIEAFRPHCIASASKGVAYIVALWQRRIWRGPSLVINKHPTLLTLPKDVRVVLCQGSRDETYPTPREALEKLMLSGTPNHCLLYWTGDSGQIRPGTFTRYGDQHNMASLLAYETLPRLLDAAMAINPELSLMRSWRNFLTPERREAERFLGYEPGRGEGSSGLRRFWKSSEQGGMDEQILFELRPDDEDELTRQEYAALSAMFYAQPTVPRAYHDMNPGMWQNVEITKIERVENGMQDDGNVEPYFKSVKRAIQNQGVQFEPFIHTTWAFHGSSAIQEIVSNPISGFQPPPPVCVEMFGILLMWAIASPA